MRFVRKVGDRGTITLPVEIRELMEIHSGDIVELDIKHVTPAKTHIHSEVHQ